MLELYRKNNCEAVQAPCDQFVNKAIKGAARDMRDEVTSMAIATQNIFLFKLMCGFFGFHGMSTHVIKESFQV